jgi:hypothetical protein
LVDDELWEVDVFGLSVGEDYVELGEDAAYQVLLSDLLAVEDGDLDVRHIT